MGKMGDGVRGLGMVKERIQTGMDRDCQDEEKD
jgi:hypothetical protein